MAKERVESMVTPEITKSSRVETRRYSSGKASSGNGNEKIVPHYRRASTGSCHDFCKYGGKHAFEEKEKRSSIPNRATRKQLHHSSEESIVGKMKSIPRLGALVDSRPTKVSTIKLTESIDSKSQFSDTSDTYNLELPIKLVNSKKEIGDKVPENRKKSSLMKVKSSILLKPYISPPMKTVKEVQSPSESTLRKVEASPKSTPNKVEASPESTPNKVEASPESTPMKIKTPPKSIPKKVENPSKATSKVKTSSKPTSVMVETSSQLSPLKGKEMKLSAKNLSSLNSNRVARKQMSSVNSSEGSGGQRKSKIEMEKGAAFSKTAPRKVMAPLSSPRPSLKRVASINSRKHKGLKIGSHLKNQPTARKIEPEKLNDNEVEEKTLYVIKTESENKTFAPGQNTSYDDESYLPQLSSPKSLASSIYSSLCQEDQEESEYTTSEFELDSFSGNHETEYMENEETLEDKKGKQRKHGIVCSEDKGNQIIKLKFRRGKVIENKIEISSPRRLKFRRAKLSGEKTNVKANGQRKRFNITDGACDDSNNATTAPEKVVLRHQDMQDKKDAQGLFNNVIEETASKLVETRKSKVKALVGAFETVISLQEKKPPANTIS